ncbi:MAG TPA: galactonate dehydratase [Bryobacteraceae bacterium]|jgi:galactonate dehydratase|nr:galactonate dehydratase [Bryobacteraceae bacterium]
MKIKSVKPWLIGAKSRDWVIVKVETDDDLTGIGEATLEGRSATVAAAVEEMSRYFLNKDPLQIERHFQHIYRGQFWRGGAVLMSAFSGIEQALWDIAGKALSQPVNRLLGGPVRDRVKVYANGWLGGASTISEAVSRAECAVKRGFHALKLPGFAAMADLSGTASYLWALDCARAVRNALGPQIDLMVDMHGRGTPAEAISLVKEYETLNIYFLEEPVGPENVAALAEVKHHSALRIATGERLCTRFGFREVLERRAADVIQPDLCHCGGILEAKKIAAMAETYYVDVAPHNPNGPVSTAASVEFSLATQNFAMLEFMMDDAPWREEVFPDAYDLRNGYMLPRQRPGLGVEMNEAAARRYPPTGVDLPVCHLEDGTIAEW